MADSWDSFPDAQPVATAQENSTASDEWGQFQDPHPDQFSPGAILGQMTQKMLSAPPDSQLSQARRLPNRILYGVNRWPVMGRVLGLTYDAAVVKAANRIKEDKAGPNDYAMVANHLASAKEYGDETTLQKIGDAIGHLPAFGVEFAMTGGAFTGAKQAVGSALGAAAKTAAGRGAQMALSAGAGVAAQAAANPQLVGQQAVQRMMPPMQMQTAPSGEVANVKIGEGKSLAESLPPAFLDTMIELGSERTGAHIMGALGSLAKRLNPFQRGVVATWLTKPGRTLTQAEEILKAGGFDGMLGEIAEERVGEAARIATGLQSPQDTVLGQLVTNPSAAAQQLGIEAATFAIPGAVVAASHFMPQQAQPDPALQDRLDAVQQQYVEGQDNQKWLEQQALLRDQAVSDSAHRQMDAEQRQQRQEADKAALDKHFRERMGQDVQPDTSLGGIRQLPLSPDVDLNAPPASRQPDNVELGQLPERIPTQPPIAETVPLEQGQAPDFNLTNQWQSLPDGALRPRLPGAESYTAQDGITYVRATQGPTLENRMAAREAELSQLAVPELNQIGSRYGLERGMNKGAKIKQILAAEEQRELSGPRQPAPSGQMIEPLQGERQSVMLGLQNPISEIYDPRANQPKSILNKKPLADAVSQTQQEMQDAIATGQGERGSEYTGTLPGTAPSENGPQVRAAEGTSNRPGDSLEQAGQEAAVQKEEVVPTYHMLDFDQHGQLTARTELPHEDAHRMLMGRETVLRRLLECLT